MTTRNCEMAQGQCDQWILLTEMWTEKITKESCKFKSRHGDMKNVSNTRLFPACHSGDTKATGINQYYCGAKISLRPGAGARAENIFSKIFSAVSLEDARMKKS